MKVPCTMCLCNPEEDTALVGVNASPAEYMILEFNMPVCRKHLIETLDVTLSEITVKKYEFKSI